MGLIRIPKDITSKCAIYDLSCVSNNEVILRNHLNTLLRINGNQPGSDSIVSFFQNFPTLDVDMEFLDWEHLLNVYTEQSALVNLAFEIGEERRSRNRVMSRIGDPTILTPAAIDQEDSYSVVLSLVHKRKSPDALRELVLDIKKRARSGDIIDMCGYRGTGYFFVTQTDFDQNVCVAKKTLGRYGCHLPVEAWPYVLHHGVSYFDKADLWACALPDRTKVRICKDNREFRTTNAMISWLREDEALEIDGKTFHGDILFNS